MKIIDISIKFIKNKYVIYLFTRYITYVLLFITSLIIAQKLGPLFFGIWGFITLIIQYFNNLNFGIPHSLTAILAINKGKRDYSTLIFNTSLVMCVILSLVVLVSFIIMKYFNIGVDYNISKYYLWIFIIVMLNYYVMLFSNMFRVYDKLWEISLSQSVVPLLTLFSILIFDSEYLIDILVLVTCIGPIISLFFFIKNTPLKLKPFFSIRLAKTIQKRANFLFLYNTSFYFIMISTRVIISSFFSVIEFGYFSFSFTLANAILLLLESISFLILPKMVHKLSKANDNDSYSLLSEIQTVFVTLSHGLIHLAIFFIPFLFIFFEKYLDAINLFRLLALTLVLYTNSFGCSNLLMAKGKERIMGFIAFTILVINVIFVYIISLYTKDINLSIMGTGICYLVYSYILNYSSYRILNIENPIKKIITDTFPSGLFIPYMVSILIILIKGNNFLFIIPFFLYILLSRKRLKFSYVFFKKVILKI